MNTNTCLVVDVWEGQLEIDEDVLKKAGVAGISIRLNDMNGGHHMDTGFMKQWEEAKGFVRFPYFVYNPWVSGSDNYKWLADNIPEEAKSVAIDVEVRYNAITPAKYAGELNKFLELANKKWKTILYTGQGYLNLLSKWPKTDYWWAQYPDPNTYFKGCSTWDDLKTRLDNDKLNTPFNARYCPGTIKMWQFSGDYLILPGTVRDIDVNLFFGSAEELAEYFQMEPGDEDVNEEEPGNTGKVIVKAVRVRKGPSVSTEPMGAVYQGSLIGIGQIVIGYKQRWGQIEFEGGLGWVALEYFGQKLIEVENDQNAAQIRK